MLFKTSSEKQDNKLFKANSIIVFVSFEQPSGYLRGSIIGDQDEKYCAQ
jgi:hypothetical protein